MTDNPFGNIPFLGDMLKMLGQQGSMNLDVARQFAVNIASEGQPESNPDPLSRMSLEELVRIADLHVGAATGLPTSASGRGVTVRTVTRTDWALRTIEAYKPLFESMAEALSAAPEATSSDELETLDPGATMMGQMLRSMSPLMLGMAVGSLVGHLSQRSFGQYDLPIPRPPGDELLVIVDSLDSFGADWELPADDLRLWVCLHEVAHHAVLSVPHVRARLTELLTAYVRGFRPDPGALERRLGDMESGLDPTALSAASGPLGPLQDLFSDPEAMFGATRSPEQAAVEPQLEALAAVVAGVVDDVMDRMGSRYISSYGRITEALRRRRIESAAHDRWLERLLGLRLGASTYERGRRFVDGVVERSGPDGLVPMWQRAEALPTPAEVDAPGLWLARLAVDG